MSARVRLHARLRLSIRLQGGKKERKKERKRYSFDRYFPPSREDARFVNSVSMVFETYDSTLE
jgi:hypothetical protein